MDNRLQRRHPIIQTIFDNWPYFLILIFLWRFPYLVADWTNSEVAPSSPRVVSESKFWQSVMLEVFLLVILSMSYNLMLGFTGLISFGHGAFFGAAVYVVSILMRSFEISLESSIGVALMTCVLISLIWALAAFRLRGVYFAMFTLAFAEIFFLGSRLSIFKDLTGAEDGITLSNSVEWPEWISPVRNRLQLYYLGLAALIFTFLIIRRLMNSPTGKVLQAIRGNETRAQTLGFNIYLYKAVSIMTAGFFAGLAGVLHTLLNRQAEPSVLGLGRTTDPLIMSLIGGLGTIPGPGIGAALLRIGEEFLRKPDLHVDLDFIIFRYTATVDATEYWNIGLGIIFIVFVMAIPYGIVGEVNRYWLEARRWLRLYLWNPIVKSNTQLAQWAEPISGEPPELALAAAQQPPPMTIPAWVMQYPFAAMNAFTLVVVSVGGVVMWDWRVSARLFLFLLLISIPIRIGVLGQRGWQWIQKQRQANAEQAPLTTMSVAASEGD